VYESHEVSNGLLLRSDIHRLFDAGYVTVTPDYEFKVSGRLREDFNNGETYYGSPTDRSVFLTKIRIVPRRRCWSAQS